MKSLSYLFCVLCLTFTLTGCSGDADTKADSKGGETSTTEEGASDSKEDHEDHEDHKDGDEK